mgnify:FL=1|jgi:hypothetical protein|tara:strand:- start:973 stop:1599 length:627 start_codon:yes stop_codon:yes gene_type:complete
MVKTETDGTLEGIESRIIKYDADGNAQKSLGKFLDDSTRIKKEMGVEDNVYWHKNGRVKSILGSYGPSRIFLSYLCDDNGLMQDATIVTASVEHGGQARDLIEDFLNSNGALIGTALQRHRKLEEIDLGLQESRDIGRVLHLTTEPQYSRTLLNEEYSVFVAERNGQSASINDDFATEPHTQTSLHNVQEIPKWYQRLAKVIKNNLKI